MEKEVVDVRFRPDGRAYCFSPEGLTLKAGDFVVCDTAKGSEFGRVARGNYEKSSETLPVPLRKVLRSATDEDLATREKSVEARERARKVCLEKIRKYGLGMKLCDAECSFDMKKLVFFFTAENRVDFRELVRDLAAEFHVRIEMRQIYERDDAKRRGGLGPCGRPCCCSEFLSDLGRVSIKMAKTQGLSLNPAKLCGSCGKLMCCLRFEDEFYRESAKLMPKVKSQVRTPDGDGTVVSNNVIRMESQVRVFANGESALKTYKIADLEFDRSAGAKPASGSRAGKASEPAKSESGAPLAPEKGVSDAESRESVEIAELDAASIDLVGLGVETVGIDDSDESAAPSDAGAESDARGAERGEPGSARA